MPTTPASISPSRTPESLHELMQASGLAPLVLRGRHLLPVVQGGMGVGVSAQDGQPRRPDPAREQGQPR